MTNLKVLIVEDEIFVGWELESALKEAGHQVCGVAESADEAVALADHHQPDLVLLDIGLYGAGNGLEAAREITRRHRAKIVFSSAWNDEATLSAIEALEAFASIRKPCRIQDVVDTVNRAAAEIRTQA